VPTKEELHKGFELGEWEVLPAKGILRCGDREEKPEPMVFRVLLALASRDGDLVTREELIDDIWDGRPIGDEPINRCVALLRAHLGDKERPHQYIETLTRRGYRLSQEVRLNEPADPEPVLIRPVGRNRYRRRFWMAIAALIVAVLVATYIRIISLPPPVQSIAVLPFDNLSGDPADQYLASGIKEELVYTLHGIPDIDVKHGRVAYPDMEVSDIAQILGVDAVLFGAVQRDGDMLKINYHVARGYDGKIISSGEIPGPIGEVFVLQGKLAVSVRNDLVGESPQQLISASRNPDPDAFDRYMRGLDAFDNPDPDAFDRYMRGLDAFDIRGQGQLENLDAAIELFEQSIEIDPGFGPAYLSLAMAYALLPDYRNAPLAETHERALEIVERGVTVDPSLADAAGAVYGFVYHKQRQWSKAEQAYIRATTARAVDTNAFNWYSLMLASVGRLDDALEKILEAQRIDPSAALINGRAAVSHTWLGNSDEAAEFYDRSSRLGASSDNHLLYKALLLIRDGREDEAGSLTFAGVSAAGLATDWIGPVFAAIQDPSLRDAALIAINEAFENRHVDPRLVIVARAMLDDVNGAMDVANSLAVSGKVVEMEILFLPELRSLRQHPGFPGLMDKLGVQDYWDEKGCVWLDDSVHCPD